MSSERMTMFPLTIKDANGNLEQLDRTDIAFSLEKAGEYIVDTYPASTDRYNGSVCFNATTSTLIGTATDTRYAVATGAHGTASQIQYTTTAYPFHQLDDTFSSPSFAPILSADSDGNIFEMTDAMLNLEVKESLKLSVFFNMPGSFYLASSNPDAAVYELFNENIFVDIHGSTITGYDIYRKTQNTTPTTTAPWTSPSLGNNVVYDVVSSKPAVKGLTEAQMAEYYAYVTMQLRAMSGIGDYVLLSSAQGTPTAAGYSGDWQARGTATDVKRDTTTTNYGGFVGYTGTRPGPQDTYFASAQSTYVGQANAYFSGNRWVNVPGLGDFYNQFLALEGGSFTGSYAANYAGQYQGASQQFLETQSYAGTRSGGKGGQTSYHFFAGDEKFAGTRQFQGYYGGSRQRTYTGQRIVYFSGTRPFLGQRNANYVGPRYFLGGRGFTSGDFTSQANYSGEEVQSSTSIIETYTLYVRYGD